MCETLQARGVELLNGPMDRPWGIRTASFRDPGGYIWEIAKREDRLDLWVEVGLAPPRSKSSGVIARSPQIEAVAVWIPTQ